MPRCKHGKCIISEALNNPSIQIPNNNPDATLAHGMSTVCGLHTTSPYKSLHNA
jgi:hypothetical protein